MTGTTEGDAVGKYDDEPEAYRCDLCDREEASEDDLYVCDECLGSCCWFCFRRDWSKGGAGVCRQCDE